MGIAEKEKKQSVKHRYHLVLIHHFVLSNTHNNQRKYCYK